MRADNRTAPVASATVSPDATALAWAHPIVRVVSCTLRLATEPQAEAGPPPFSADATRSSPRHRIRQDTRSVSGLHRRARATAIAGTLTDRTACCTSRH